MPSRRRGDARDTAVRPCGAMLNGSWPEGEDGSGRSGAHRPARASARRQLERLRALARVARRQPGRSSDVSRRRSGDHDAVRPARAAEDTPGAPHRGLVRGSRDGPRGCRVMDASQRTAEARAQPDECYFVGHRGRGAEAPDVTIEVVWTSADSTSSPCTAGLAFARSGSGRTSR